MSVVTYYTPLPVIERMLDSALTAMQALKSKCSSLSLRIILIENSEIAQLNLSMFDSFSRKLESNRCELRLIQGQGNIGYGAGQNLGIVSSKDEFHLVMNPDVELHKDSLTEGVSYLQNNPEVAIASPAASNDLGVKQYLCKRMPTLWVLFLRGFMPGFIQGMFAKSLASYEMQDLSTDSSTNDIPIVSGCFMLCRTQALHRVAGFNEDYFLYFEDFDLSMRLSEQYSLAYVPGMKIIHHGGNASRKGIRHIQLFIKSAIRYFDTYGWRIF